MSAPQELLHLIERFDLHVEAYKSGHYNETQLRREFLDPFFKLLGWDIDNTAGYAEAYKDVIHEDALKSAAAQRIGTPDYCFRIGGTRKFFLEAKKPSVFIKEEIPPAFQLRSYAWSAKLPLSVLSDFEEFAIYDCRIKPNKNDSAAVARVFYCTFRDYLEKWDHISSIFSRDSILKGSFDKFAETNKAKRGTAEIDADFLAQIENWRKELAQNLALRNPDLTQRELNFAVQRIIDRIVFLRICEDRGTEDYGRLQALVNGPRIYPRLAQLFQQADDRYNSGLFHFKPERDRHEEPDELTLDLEVDDDLLRGIFKSLYYPESPYVFSFVPSDILGQVYEQFLGKVIRLTPNHRAVIEEKPEVKKAGGVYYTPTYIVDYIVRNTVGALLDEISGVGRAVTSAPSSPRAALEGNAQSLPSETPAAALLVGRDVPIAPPPTTATTFPTAPAAPVVRSPQAVINKIAKLKILDPACGSLARAKAKSNGPIFQKSQHLPPDRVTRNNIKKSFENVQFHPVARPTLHHSITPIHPGTNGWANEYLTGA